MSIDTSELLEMAAVAVVHLKCEFCPARDGCPAFEDGNWNVWPCHTAPVQLRELAQKLEAASGVGEEEKE